MIHCCKDCVAPKREGIVLEMICPVCGKIFVPAGQHTYKTPGSDKRLVCTYSCVLKAEREHEAKTKKKNKGNEREINYENH